MTSGVLIFLSYIVFSFSFIFMSYLCRRGVIFPFCVSAWDFVEKSGKMWA